MKRLTGKYENGTAYYNIVPGESTIDRLAAYEDILGDEYDLDRLRELMKADREGRCVVPVVRCRDCKWFNRYTMECESDDVATDNEGGASFSLNFGPDDFCSYGQRKIETVLPKSDEKDKSLEAEHEVS